MLYRITELEIVFITIIIYKLIITSEIFNIYCLRYRTHGNVTLLFNVLEKLVKKTNQIFTLRIELRRRKRYHRIAVSQTIHKRITKFNTKYRYYCKYCATFTRVLNTILWFFPLRYHSPARFYLDTLKRRGFMNTFSLKISCKQKLHKLFIFSAKNITSITGIMVHIL